MPTFVIPADIRRDISRYKGGRIPYCTEAELMEFANKVRQAGGANIIDAFMPSEPEQPTACLIANALNFSCSVVPAGEQKSNGEHDHWYMALPKNMSIKKAQTIADAVNCRLYTHSGRYGVIERRIVLPRLIGNAAHAFDSATRGWVTKYRIKDDE